MLKLNQKGGVFIVLVIFFVAVAGVASFVVYKSVSTSSKRISEKAEVLNVALQTNYENPFDENAQYENPFDEYQNPFDELK